MAHVYMLRRRN